MGLGDLVTNLLDLHYFWTGRARAWKQLAKEYKRKSMFILSQPGLMLARIAYDMKDDPREIGKHAAECMGWMFQDLLDTYPASPNFIEVTLTSPTKEPVYVTVQRPNGKSPATLLAEAKKERDEAKAELELLREQSFTPQRA